jgi:hypothetical protein
MPSLTCSIGGVLEIYETYNLVAGCGWPAAQEIHVVVYTPDGALKEEHILLASGSGGLPWTRFHTGMEDEDSFNVTLCSDQPQFRMELPRASAHMDVDIITGPVQPFQPGIRNRLISNFGW